MTSGCLPRNSSKEKEMKLNWKKTSVVIAVAGALLLTVAAVAFSHGHRMQGPPRGGGFRGGPGARGAFGALLRPQLTDEQKAQIQKNTDRFEESNKALFDQIRALHGSRPQPHPDFDSAN